jgi:hypothetical protein
VEVSPSDLTPTGVTFQGAWQKPSKNAEGLPVLLSREERARLGDNRVLARRVLHTTATPRGTSTVTVFVPVIEGPAAARLMPNVTKLIAAQVDVDEPDSWAGLTALDFDVSFADVRVLTLDVVWTRYGAYPSAGGARRSFDWATGAPIDRASFRPDKRESLVKLLGTRVLAAWKQKRDELVAVGDKPGECDMEIADSFFTDPPTVTADILDSVAVGGQGVTFDFDMDLPHVALACSPSADLSFSWEAIRPFLDPRGPLGYR